MVKPIEEILEYVDKKVTEELQSSLPEVSRGLELRWRANFGVDLENELDKLYERINHKSSGFFRSLWHSFISDRTARKLPQVPLVTCPVIPDAIYTINDLINGSIDPTEINKDSYGYNFSFAEMAVQAKLSRYYIENGKVQFSVATIVQQDQIVLMLRQGLGGYIAYKLFGDEIPNDSLKSNLKSLSDGTGTVKPEAILDPMGIPFVMFNFYARLATSLPNSQLIQLALNPFKDSFQLEGTSPKVVMDQLRSGTMHQVSMYDLAHPRDDKL